MYDYVFFCLKRSNAMFIEDDPGKSRSILKKFWGHWRSIRILSELKDLPLIPEPAGLSFQYRVVATARLSTGQPAIACQPN
jgi:hypothetical protein